MKFSSLGILIGDEVLDSTADRIASSMAKPLIFLSKFLIPSIRASEIYSGKIFLRLASSYFPLNMGFIF